MPLHGGVRTGQERLGTRPGRALRSEWRGDAGTLKGNPVIVLTTVGAKTGRLRKTALMRVEHHGRYAVVASKGVAATNPRWYFNLVANPHVELQDGPVKRDYMAHEAHGSERAEWWPRAVAVWPDYDGWSRSEVASLSRTWPSPCIRRPQGGP